MLTVSFVLRRKQWNAVRQWKPTFILLLRKKIFNILYEEQCLRQVLTVLASAPHTPVL